MFDTKNQWRRFNVIGGPMDMHNLNLMMSSKGLAREDLMLIFRCLEPNPACEDFFTQQPLGATAKENEELMKYFFVSTKHGGTHIIVAKTMKAARKIAERNVSHIESLYELVGDTFSHEGFLM